MGCSSSQATTTAIDETKAKTRPNSKMADLPKPEYPASEAFTIPLDDDVASSTDQLNDTLRQPPKRLQQLMQQAAETEPITFEELEDKQQRAEQRRQELLQQKVETIQKNTQMLMRAHGEREETVEGAEQVDEEQQPKSTQD
ncbi:uncharacterized protein LOC6559628 [Drosophila grimshawi]|uniref:GH20990 n=1 Tax=Drosophila grimshawi TaxID=7222 RepID=B4J4U0_DROGR|nr:uncharacterized protein LOC6559628 [Drosophila grimshawi]EDW00636.1 GH20990 [Drosophila grimshawi]